MEAAKSFRLPKPSYDKQIVARVVKLEREPREFDGKAEIQPAQAKKSDRIQVEFAKSVYDTVIQAFQEQRSISLDGDVHPRDHGRGYDLHNPRNLIILPEG